MIEILQTTGDTLFLIFLEMMRFLFLFFLKVLEKNRNYRYSRKFCTMAYGECYLKSNLPLTMALPKKS